MAAQGQCPGCGAPIEFRMGSSVSAVCQYCNTTVRRTDRGLENLGKIAALADTPSIVAVGDSGSIGDQSFQVLGKVQLNHDMGGVWDEWYVGFNNGQWGWLAYAQGVFLVTWKVEPTPPVPAMSDMRVESSVDFGQRGAFRVVELKQATIASAEGELPFAPQPGQARYYADLHGPNSGFGTIDWGTGAEPVEVFLGYQLLESQLRITQQVERPERQVNLEGINCPRLRSTPEAQRRQAHRTCRLSVLRDDLRVCLSTDHRTARHRPRRAPHPLGLNRNDRKPAVHRHRLRPEVHRHRR